jgi:hypothetical protein
MILQAAASYDWKIVVGDVENGFLQGAYWDHTLYFRVPTGGFPAVELEDGRKFPEIPGGTLLRAKKAAYGTADAPFEWNKEHDVGLQECGLIKSSIVPTLYYWFQEADETEPDVDEQGDQTMVVDGITKLPRQMGRLNAVLPTKQRSLGGILGVHVDDDIVAVSPDFYRVVVPRLIKHFVYGSWHEEEMTFCGIDITRGDHDGVGRPVVLSQKGYTKSLERTPLSRERRSTLSSPLTPEEKRDLRSGLAKVGWLARNTRPDLVFRVQRGLQNQDKDPATVELIADFNRIVNDAHADASISMTIQPIPLILENLLVIVPADSSWGNMDEGEASQAGHLVFLAELSEFHRQGAGMVSILAMRSHMVRRSVKSSMGCEALAMVEGQETGDLYRALLLEMLHPGFQVRNW